MGKLERRRGEGAPLADKSTLNRLEQNYRWDDSAAVNPRYVKTTVAPIALEAVWLRLLFAEHSTPPPRLILEPTLANLSPHDYSIYLRQPALVLPGVNSSTIPNK